jgi:hypothetical protein
MHDSKRMAIVESLKDLIQVISAVLIGQLSEQRTIINSLNMLKHQAAYLLVTDDIEQLDSVITTCQSL